MDRRDSAVNLNRHTLHCESWPIKTSVCGGLDARIVARDAFGRVTDSITADGKAFKYAEEAIDYARVMLTWVKGIGPDGKIEI